MQNSLEISLRMIQELHKLHMYALIEQLTFKEILCYKPIEIMESIS
jgi:hypothetical protein